MIYTFSTRRKLNSAFREMFPDAKVEENKDSVPMMIINQLPAKACLVENVHEIENAIKPCAFSWKSVVPVFVRIGVPGTHLFRVNYVNLSEISLMQAEKYISQERLYWIKDININL